MMTDLAPPAAVAADLLYREGLHLDRQEWDAWLALYRDDAVFWVPAWKDEHRATEDPDTEVSLIYHSSLEELKERVKRVRSRKTVTALPLPRTVHFVSNLIVAAVAEDSISTTASWMVHAYDPRTARQSVHCGRCEHTLRRREDGLWQIGRKKIFLINDQIPSAIDFYHL
jgi:3-phenylpropionate/cinnamic acid dioxygenase small subunit